jgi:predicted membrane chloride channel (bestrophin family)
MQLIPQWRKWWRRWSTWLALMIPILAMAREALPELREIIDPQLYKVISGCLGFAVVVAMQIKQHSVSGENKP